MIVVQCPDCDKSLRVPDEFAGRVVKCPKCDYKIAVPGVKVGGKTAKPSKKESVKPPKPSESESSAIEEKPRRAGPPKIEPVRSKRPRREEDDDLDEDDRPRGRPVRSRSRDDESEGPPRGRRREDDDDSDGDEVQTRRKPKGFAAKMLRTYNRLSTPLKIVPVVAAISVMLACIHPIFYIAPVAVGMVLSMSAGIWLLVIAFQEDVMQGIMVMFLPLYIFVYLVTRWQQTWRPISLSAFAFLLPMTVGLFAPIHSLIFEIPGLRNPNPVIQNAKNELPVGPRPNVNIPPADRKGIPPRQAGEITIPELLNDLDSDLVFTRLDAAKRLAAMKPTDDRPMVVQRLAKLTSDPAVRLEAVKAIKTWASPNEIPVLNELLASKDVFVRQDVLAFIGKFKDERTLKPVVDCIREASVRVAAGNAFKDMGPMAEKTVLGLMTDQDDNVRTIAIMVLKDIGTPQSIPILEDRAKNGIGIERLHARTAIQSIQNRNVKK